MRFTIPKCPECGGDATGTLEQLYAWADLTEPGDDGEFDYDGHTTVLWDTQETLVDDGVWVTLCCANRHEWKAQDLDEAAVPAERSEA